jgi:hypothetical protein
MSLKESSDNKKKGAHKDIGVFEQVVRWEGGRKGMFTFWTSGGSLGGGE